MEIDTIALERLREHLNHHMNLKPSSLEHKMRAMKSLFKNLFKKGSGKPRAVQGSEPGMRTERTFSVREGAFLAMTPQCAGEF